MRRPLLWLLALAAILTASVGWMILRGSGDERGWANASPALQAILWPGPRPVAAFELNTQHGETFSAARLHGQWSVLYFGFLQCPDVCPTSLQAMSEMRELLVKENANNASIRFVFVSVDPDNDSAEAIARYLGFFSDQLVGLRGEPAQLDALAKSLGVMYSEYRDAKGVRSIDHTTSIILVDPQGRGVGALPGPPHQPKVMLQQFNELRQFLAP